MIQDIGPLKLNNEYQSKEPKEQSILFFFSKNQLLVGGPEEEEMFPTFAKMKEILNKDSLIYLFSVGTEDYFLVFDDEIVKENSGISDILKQEKYEWKPMNSFRTGYPKAKAYAAITAFHLFTWYRVNQFCGCCGHKLVRDKKERMMHCESCGQMIYPRISPSVIVGILDGDRILLTKYADREYKNYSLVAGFTEIGETVEQTVEREVMEEVGLKVKNIRYYKSQPWGFSGGLLLGFFAQLDGDDTITMDDQELSVATWVKRDDMEFTDNGVSLTGEMMQLFKNNLDI